MLHSSNGIPNATNAIMRSIPSDAIRALGVRAVADERRAVRGLRFGGRLFGRGDLHPAATGGRLGGWVLLRLYSTYSIHYDFYHHHYYYYYYYYYYYWTH